MKIDPDAPTTDAVFRTDEGDYKVSLFSNEGKLKFKLAQPALRKLAKLSDSVMIQREALSSLRQSIIDHECTEAAKIKTKEE